MDSSPRGRGRELQGPRPSPLKVRKDSMKIKKPPTGPQPTQQPAAAQPVQHRPPVIIYTVSPKVIHTNPSDFMSLVQRLTGASSSSVEPSINQPPSNSGGLSPAARLATIEKSVQPWDVGLQRQQLDQHVMDRLNGFDSGSNSNRPWPVSFPAGILSPMPASLPPISPNFFSPSVDPNSLSFLHEFSPAFHGNKSFVENTFLNSPGNNMLSSPLLPSPTSYWDLFNQFQDS